MNKVGVLQIIDSLNAGGAEVLAVNIANELSSRGLNSHLCTTRAEGILKGNINNKTGFLFLERKKSLDFRAIFRLRNYIVKNNISILQAHSSSVFIAICIKFLKPNVKIIWHDHYGKSEELEFRNYFILKLISPLFKAIISVNTNLKNWAKEKLLCKNVFFFNNFAMFNVLDKTTILKGLENKRVIHLAAFREQKDHETLINAFVLFLKENKNWTLHLVGEINNDLYSEKISALIKSKGLEKHIFVYRACKDIYNILNQSTIGVLSSKSEGLPISLLEYGLAKLPVIVTNVGECNRVVEQRKSGIIIEKENSLELAKALEELVVSEEKRKLYGELLHKEVERNYSKESFINQLIKLYQ